MSAAAVAGIAFVSIWPLSGIAVVILLTTGERKAAKAADARKRAAVRAAAAAERRAFAVETEAAILEALAMVDGDWSAWEREVASR